MKRFFSIILVILMIFNFAVTTMAEELDLININNPTQKYSFFDFMDSPSIFDEILNNMNIYVIETSNGKYYKVSEIDSETSKGKSFDDAAASLTPVTIGNNTGTASEQLDKSVNNLTFNVIKAANTIEQSITSNLVLPTQDATYSNVKITWTSSSTSAISNQGVVSRPSSDLNDVVVNLTATLTDGISSKTKSFILVVRKLGVNFVSVKDADSHFSDGYPIAYIESGSVKIKYKLNKAAQVYISVGQLNAEDYDFNVKGILHGHFDDNDATSEKDAVYAEYCTYKNSQANVECLIDTNIKPNEGQDIEIGFVVKEGNTYSTAVTSIVFDMDDTAKTINASPIVEAAYINKAKTEIYVYYSELLDENSVPPTSAFALSDTSATVTGVSIVNLASGCINSFVKLNVSGVKDGSVFVSYTPPQTNAIKDKNGNAVASVESIACSEASVKIKAVYVNASNGYMKVTLGNAFKYSGDYSLLKNDITVLSGTNNVAVNFLRSKENFDGIDIIYTFAPIITGTPNFKISLNPMANMKTMANDTVSNETFNGTVEYMPIANNNISAAYYNADNVILITFDNGFKLEDRSIANCCFTLNIDGKDYVLRGYKNAFNAYYPNKIAVYLDDSIPTITSVNFVKISYNSGDDVLTDMSGAFVSTFINVNVTVN